MIAAAGLAGSAIGAAIDVAAAGLTFGIFTAIGGAAGAGWAALGGGQRLIKAKVLGINLGGYQIKIGPIENIQFLYVLLDRSLIFYSHVINWAHGHRDYDAAPTTRISESVKSGFTAEWDDNAKRICTAFFMALRSSDEVIKEESRKKLKGMLKDVLQKISHSERKYGLICKS